MRCHAPAMRIKKSRPVNSKTRISGTKTEKPVPARLSSKIPINAGSLPAAARSRQPPPAGFRYNGGRSVHDGAYGFLRSQSEGVGGLEEPPFDSEFGQKIYQNVSKTAWKEWVDRQKMLFERVPAAALETGGRSSSWSRRWKSLLWRGIGQPKDFVPPSH